MFLTFAPSSNMLYPLLIVLAACPLFSAGGGLMSPVVSKKGWLDVCNSVCDNRLSSCSQTVKCDGQTIIYSGQSVTCEGQTARLLCNYGHVLVIHSAIYGRDDRTTCSTNRPGSQISNTNCGVYSDKVAESCNGKKSCSIRANNNMFGDPCVGTYKYLRITYSCQRQSLTCEGYTARPGCGYGHGLVIHNVIYGRDDKRTCSRNRPWSQLRNTNCGVTSNKVAEICNGKKTCSIRANNKMFGDPCSGTHKYLRMTYSCQRQSVTCEGRTAKLTCGYGEVLAIHSAIYGRNDKTTCSSYRPWSQLRNTNCVLHSSKVAEICNDKRTCSIRANNNMFGDPCVGTYKYLAVTYSCQRQMVTCEGHTDKINCGLGRVVTIVSAVYGRQDTRTCASGRPWSQIRNTKCAKCTTSKVAEICSGKYTCSIKASNSMFGDPCRGTYKYLTVTYRCD